MRLWHIALLGLLAVVLAAPVAAQDVPDWDARRELQTREELEDLLERLEQAATSPGYSGDLRARARYEAALVRQRLAEGDFQVGDRIFVTVEGEEALSDTFNVQAGRVLDLPNVGHVPLAGVLRSELESHLTSYLARFIVDPVVRAQALVRVAVVGSVSEPGFYLLSSEALLTDVLMRAGGPTSEAQITKIWIERGDEKIWDGDPLQEAIAEGRTLDQLNLRAGDRIVVPQEGGGVWGTVRNIGILLGLGLSVTLIARGL